MNPTDDLTLDQKKSVARAWFETLRDRIHAGFEVLEDAASADLFPGDLKTGTRRHRHGALLGARLKHSVMTLRKSSAFRTAHICGG